MKVFVHTLFHHAVAHIVMYSYPNRKCEPIKVLACTDSKIMLAYSAPPTRGQAFTISYIRLLVCVRHMQPVHALYSYTV